MGKRCFVRINVHDKQYKLDRRDLAHTHFLKKDQKPRIPAFFSKLKCPKDDPEDSETFFGCETDFNREECSSEEWETSQPQRTTFSQPPN